MQRRSLRIKSLATMELHVKQPGSRNFEISKGDLWTERNFDEQNLPAKAGEGYNS